MSTKQDFAGMADEERRLANETTSGYVVEMERFQQVEAKLSAEVAAHDELREAIDAMLGRAEREGVDGEKARRCEAIDTRPLIEDIRQSLERIEATRRKNESE